MSTKYKHSHEVPTAVLAKRLDELSDAVGKRGEERDRELTRRIPAELDRDADLVLLEASTRLLKLETQITGADERAKRQRQIEAQLQGEVNELECRVMELATERDALAAPNRDMVAHMHRQIAFSTRAFGPGDRQAGVIDHIRKELREIEAAPHDLEEWIDVVLLALDGAWRSGHRAEEVAAMLDAKLTKNEKREWPDWRTADRSKAIEHDRTKDKEANS